MGLYSIQWRNSVRKDLRPLPHREVLRVLAAVDEPATEPQPHGAQKLTGSENTYRIRVGDYRIIYDVFDECLIVEVLRVRHRKDAYRN